MLRTEQWALIRMRIKVQTRIPLKADSLFLEKHAIFPRGRMGQALTERGLGGPARGSARGGKAAGMTLPVSARGTLYSRPGYTKKRAGSGLQDTLPSLPPHEQTHRGEEETGRRGDLLAPAPLGLEAKGHLAQRRPEGAPRKPRRVRRRTACARRGGRLRGTLRPGRGAEAPGWAPAGRGSLPSAAPAPRSRDEGTARLPLAPPGPGQRGGALRGAWGREGPLRAGSAPYSRARVRSGGWGRRKRSPGPGPP